ncbi:MAG TPA: FtsK/SpoIIIE domain-containing protein [Acidimicrobiales bacterium]
MADGGGGSDLEIRFTPGADVTAGDLVEAWPDRPDGMLFVDGAACAERAPLAACGLADGATVAVGPPAPAALHDLHVTAGPLTPRSVSLPGRVLIGQGVACGLRIDHPSIAAAHALVESAAGGWTVCAVATGATTTLDGEPVGAPTPLRPGAVLSVGAVDLQLHVPTRPALVPPPRGPVHRAASTAAPIPDPPPAPPERPAPPPPPSPPGLASLLMPVAVGVLLALTVHPAAGLVTAATPILAVGAHLDARRRHRRLLRRDDAERAEDVDRHRQQLATHQHGLAGRERTRFPTPVEALAQARSGAGLWAVREGDPTIRQVAVGWADDPVRAPAIVSLDGNRRIGVAGPGPWADAVARALVVQLTARAGPTAWTLSVPAEPAWRFARWLPHSQGSGAALSVGHDGDGPGIEVADHRAQLTDRCAAVLAWSPDGARLWAAGDGDGRPVRPFLASVELAEDYGRASARWTDPDPASATLPDRLGLASLLPEAALAREDGRRSLAAPLGVGADGVVTVDLVVDGPHALVAGTTGAGKSELLRTWVTALAHRHPPTAVAFVLVDYKGGSAFDVCARLPHVTGVVTDLDAGLGERLLVGLRAEIREREAGLRDAGVGDLRDLVDGPPRLVVVVDEFATLAAELPDFLGALVDVARRGRSLGVHLVLATQRPAGAVNDDIRANTALRLCLRTLDAADSQDVLGGPEAALLPADRPGRAWLRQGQGLRLLQVAAGSGPDRPPDSPGVAVRRVGDSWPDGDEAGPVELDRLVDEVARAWGDRPRPTPTWRPPLPDHLRLKRPIPTGRDPAPVVLGQADRPEERTQPPLTWSPTSGHLVVLGGRRSGRTTAVRTTVLGLAGSRSAAMLHVYVVTRAGDVTDLAELPHVGAVVPAHDRAGVRRLVGRVGARTDAAGPLVVVVIDGYEALAASVDDLDGLRLLEDVDRLAHAGTGHGVALLLTSARPTLLPPSVLATADPLVILGLDDPADYGILGLRPPPHPTPPGRGRCGTGHEVQVGVLDTSATAVAAAHGPVTPAAGPPSVGPLPARVALSDLDDDGPGIGLGRRDRDLRPARTPLRPGTAFVISGPPQSGRSTAMARFLTAPDRPLTVYRAGGDAERFRAEVRAWLDGPRPRLFAVDDAETLTDPEGVLRDLVTRRHPDARIVVGVRADAWRSAYGSWLSELRPAGHGLALAPDPVRDAESWTLALPPIGPSPPPGRGVLVDDGQAAVIQVALAHE